MKIISSYESSHSFNLQYFHRRDHSFLLSLLFQRFMMLFLFFFELAYLDYYTFCEDQNGYLYTEDSSFQHYSAEIKYLIDRYIFHEERENQDNQDTQSLYKMMVFAGAFWLSEHETNFSYFFVFSEDQWGQCKIFQRKQNFAYVFMVDSDAHQKNGFCWL